MKKQILKAILSISFMLIILPQAQGKEDGMLINALQDAMVRSSDDQMNIRQRVLDERDSRMQDWSERQVDAIEIKSTASYSQPYNIGIKADVEMEESGEDTSGLNGLRSQIEEESTDINFDEELREVSLLEET